MPAVNLGEVVRIGELPGIGRVEASAERISHFRPVPLERDMARRA